MKQPTDFSKMSIKEMSAYITGMGKFVVQSGNKEMIQSMSEFLDKINYMFHPSTIDQLVIDEYKKKRTIQVTSSAD